MSTGSLARALAERVVVLDGGLASRLEERGHDLSDELWSARLLMEDPAEVRAAHHDYAAAGAEVATTASYQVSYDALAARGVDADGVDALLRLSVMLAREASDGRSWVAASVGPYGAALAGGHPCLGICLGMQLLFEQSEEGEGIGIGLVPGRVRRLRSPIVPQMGWNDVETGPDPLFAVDAPLIAYYANSFVCEPADPSHVIAWSEYEGDRFAAAVRAAHTWGVQFHPEKSSRPGLALIERFLETVR